MPQSPPATEESPPLLVSFNRVTRHTAGPGASGGPRPHWALDYHTGHTGEFSLDGQFWRPRECDTIHLYAPERLFWERSSPADIPFVETYYLFQAPDSATLRQLTNPGNGFARFSDRNGTFRTIVDNQLAALSGGQPQWRAQAGLLCLLDAIAGARHLGAGEYRLETAPQYEQLSLVQRVESYLNSHYHETVTIADLARDASISCSTLTHRYRAASGTTPMERLTHIRLATARSMILRGERLKVVATHTGFHDEFHLSRTFKRHFGYSPRDYLRRKTIDGD